MAEPSLFNQTGIQLTLALMLIIIVAGLVIVVLKFLSIYSRILKQRESRELEKKMQSRSPEELHQYEGHKKELNQKPFDHQLSGNRPPSDEKGVIRNINAVEEFRIFPAKRRTSSFIKYISPELTKLILWFLGTAIVWLVIGTTFGLYAGIKYVVPDVEHTSWLSFGRLRPAHTNAVFWGWASLAMVGLSYYVVTRVSNRENYNIRQGYISLILINAAVLAGTISLLAGVNNGGGEYREYIWPIMITFGIGIAFSAHNLFRPVAKRTVKEIYISNWYVISGFMFVIVVILVGYIPVWQNGVGETITQGYYMHQAIGMWFMMINLGLMYYFLPQ